MCYNVFRNRIAESDFKNYIVHMCLFDLTFQCVSMCFCNQCMKNISKYFFLMLNPNISFTNCPYFSFPSFIIFKDSLSWPEKFSVILLHFNSVKRMGRDQQGKYYSNRFVSFYNAKKLFERNRNERCRVFRLICMFLCVAQRF